MWKNGKSTVEFVISNRRTAPPPPPRDAQGLIKTSASVGVLENWDALN